MQELSVMKDTVISRISAVIDKLLASDSLFQERLDKSELLQIFSNILDKVSPQELIGLDEEELTDRVDKVMATEAMSRLLEDLTPEQMEIFDAAVSGT
ncbi:hypothetical protein [[Phormidium] sp. ETS-05]|uniref:hypothetical protein n=1 Tax=[Phormidium] sp. ETS-05 TaxID=222819 RepID=UPI0018EF1CFF|nr:hypothetical protein [[Phormidium] sp. ETS-05]